MWTHLSKAEYKQLCSRLSAEAIRDAHLKRKSKTTLGMNIVLSENVRKPRFTKRGTRLYVEQTASKYFKLIKSCTLSLKPDFTGFQPI